jgi:putative endonuclease
MAKGRLKGPMSEDLYCVYLLRCGDVSLYCGIAADLDRRLRQHRDGKGARYTASHLPVSLEYSTDGRFGRAEAQSIEMRVKKLRRAEKKAYLERFESRPENSG